MSCLLIVLLFSSMVNARSAVTYGFSGGRLGDDLISYLHAKWISYKYDIPLLYRPFPYSDQFVLHDEEKNIFDPAMMSQYQAIKILTKNEHLAINPDADELYVIPYFPESMEEHKDPEPGINYKNTNKRGEFAYFTVDWYNPAYLKEIRRLIRPNKTHAVVMPPPNCISIAVHVRKNCGGFDLPFLTGLPLEQYNPQQLYVDVIFPVKNPPEDYYIEQIRFLLTLFGQKKIYLFVFTDDPDPLAIVDRFKQAIPCETIMWDCRVGDTRYTSYVIEDFFSMLNFDYFIRPDSNLSIVASKVGHYKMVISPLHHIWQGRKLVIDRVSVVTMHDA